MDQSPLKKFLSLPKATLRAHIVRQMRDAILAGEIPSGSQVIETDLAKQFGVSRGPLREAMRQLIDEGLLITVPYTGTHVVEISAEDVQEIYTLRVNLETFAYEQIWEHRDQFFRKSLLERHTVLTRAIDDNDDPASIEAEFQLHGLVFEMSRHKLLLSVWESLRGRLQLHWAAHHRAHGSPGPKRDGHDSYIAAVLGHDLDVLRNEIKCHMEQGKQNTVEFLERASQPDTGQR